MPSNSRKPLPYPCPYCDKDVMLWEHIGRCNAAMIELDPNLKEQADHLKALPDSEVEGMIDYTMRVYEKIFEAKTGRRPNIEELDHIRSQVTDNLKRIRGR